MKQPALGITSTAVVILLSLAFISLFAVPVFTTWVAFLMICFIPAVILVSVTWGAQQPPFVARRTQPGRGALLLLIVLVVGPIVALVHFLAVGGSISPPPPMLSMCIITTVVITFWFAIMWGGWPFTAVTRKPVLSGFLMLAAGYVVNYLLFRVFFNFGFMRGSPLYVAALDPRGLFDAWDALVGYVTMTGAMFLMLSFEVWPFSRRQALMRQPLLGILWTGSVLAIGAAALFVGEGLFRMDAPVFMIRVPIPFIFGTIIVKNMLQDSLYARFAQPLRGLLDAVTAAVIGVALSLSFGALAPILSGRMQAGPPDYVFEIWLASALLAVTFPFLIVFAELFQFWPLQRRTPAASSRS